MMPFESKVLMMPIGRLKKDRVCRDKVHTAAKSCLFKLSMSSDQKSAFGVLSFFSKYTAFADCCAVAYRGYIIADSCLERWLGQQLTANQHAKLAPVLS